MKQIFSFGKMTEKIATAIRNLSALNSHVSDLRDLTIFQQTKELQSRHVNPLNGFGRKCFSQADEDGITLEILRRLGCRDAGVFAEFGVGDGMENGTLVLAALGWSGFWVGGEELRFPLNNNVSEKYAFIRDWVTRENAVDHVKAGLKRINAERVDVISVDLDGIDIYVVDAILNSGARPKLFIVEYNAKFPPPIKFQIAYDPSHQWQGDDYFGASLSSFNDVFSGHGYRLVCCNSHTGSNAFFVDAAYSELFSDVPTEISELYVEPRYHLYHLYGHKQSVKTVARIFGLS